MRNGGNVFYDKCFLSFAAEFMDALTKIRAAALELFRKYGFKTVTMDDVARQAGISKKTLYQHFANKEEVVQDAMRFHHERDCRYYEEALKSSSNAIETMVRVMAYMDNEFRKLNPLTILELQRFFPASFRVFKEQVMESNVGMVRANIEQGIAEGNYRPEINADLLARFRLESMMFVFHSNLLEIMPYQPHQLVHELSEHFLYGIFTPKGEKLYTKYKEKYLKTA